MVVGLLGNKSPDSNRLTLVTPKSENDVRLQAKLGRKNPTGLPVGVVSVHSEMNLSNLQSLNIWVNIVKYVGEILNKYPYTSLCIENVSPIRCTQKENIALCDNFLFDNVEIVKELRKELNTTRIYTVLDTCHAMLTEKYLKSIYFALGKTCPDYSLNRFFMENKDYIGLIHLSDYKGNGYDKGNHGIPFNDFTKGKLNYILWLYQKYEYTCPITLEVCEKDYLVCDGYKKTKELIKEIIEK